MFAAGVPANRRRTQIHMELLKQLRAFIRALSALESSISRIERANKEIISRLSTVEDLLKQDTSPVNIGNGRLLTKLRFEKFVMTYLLEADDLLLVPHILANGNYEENITKYFLRNIKSTDHIVDIGANFGYFTCLAAKCATDGKTIGIEPDPPIYKLVRDNIYINNLHDRAEAVCAAVGAESGTLALNRRRGRSGNTSIIKVADDVLSLLGEPPSEAFEARCLTVDSLLDQMDNRIDLLKIDAEGAEPLVFRGAIKTIETTQNLKIIMEWSPAQIATAGFAIDDFINDIRRYDFSVKIPTHDGGIWNISLDDLDRKTYHTGVLFEKSA